MSLNEGFVTSEIDERGLCTITFGHPSHNSLPSRLLRLLVESINQASSDDQVRVILLKADGNRTFCAGASFDELLQLDNREEADLFFQGFGSVINACRTCNKIIIGRIHGKAVGGGVGLASAVDYCFATKYAKVRLSELAVGIGPFVIGPAVERKVGKSGFSRMSLRPKDWFEAEWAMERGLYDEVFQSTDGMDERIGDLTVELLSYSQDALHAMKRVLWEGYDHWDSLLVERAAISGRLILEDHARSFLAGFKGK